MFLPDFNNNYNTYNMWLNVYFHNLIIYIYILPAVENWLILANCAYL